MTFTYVDPSKSVLHEIRFLIGDNIEEKHLVEDEEIDYALAEADNNINATCAILCNAIAAKFARESNVRVTSYSIDRQTIYDKYKQLAKEFSGSTITTAHFICPSISVTDKASSEANADSTKPSFKRGLFDNPDVADAMDEDI
jgi:hypothetical protein